MTTKTFPKIGVDNYTMFLLKDDDMKTGQATYDEPVHIPGTVEVSLTDNGATSPFDADNKAYWIESYIEKMGHELTNADITPELDAMMRGLELVDGGLEYAGNPDPPYFAAAWMILMGDGSKRLVRYYKGKYGFASNIGGKTKSSEGASEAQTASVTYSAVKRDCDDKAYYVLDTKSLPETITEAEAIEKWFSDPNWYPSNNN